MNWLGIAVKNHIEAAVKGGPVFVIGCNQVVVGKAVSNPCRQVMD